MQGSLLYPTSDKRRNLQLLGKLLIDYKPLLMNPLTDDNDCLIAAIKR
jgi:hypothetical protein